MHVRRTRVNNSNNSNLKPTSNVEFVSFNKLFRHFPLLKQLLLLIYEILSLMLKKINTQNI